MVAIAWTTIGLLGACVFGMFGMFFHLTERLAAQGADLGARIDTQGADLGARIDSLSAKIDLQGATLSARIDHLAERFDTQLHWHTK